MSLISAQTLGTARQLAAQSSRRLMEVLQDQSAMAPEAFVAELSHALHYPVLDNRTMHALSTDFEVMPFAEAYRRECIPLRGEDGQLLIVIADPFASDIQAWLLDTVHEPFTLYLAHYADVSAFLSRHEETLNAMDRVLGGDMAPDAHPVHADGVEHLSLSRISEDSSPVIRLVNSTLYDAMKIGASDIHLETTLTGLALKYRIDGVLDAVGQIQGVDMAEQIVSRIKVMAELDIAERRIPQDGRFKVHIQQREVDLRVSIMPSVYGEDAVLRILDRKSLTEQSRGLTLENVGLDALTRQQFRALAREPYGMVLVTGPTGSGKTTTLYAAISEVNTGRDKIITIEDPVEYNLPGVLQIPVNEKKGLTFARGLRSILRHDPDKIMVGEIRDSETAQIAVQSALTGHLVFTTVHANNVFDVIGRFINMDVDTYSFVSALNGILAQRLVRLNCTHCLVDDQPDAGLLQASMISETEAASMQFRKGQGCGHCRGSGYKGRMAVAELLILDDEIREMIVSRQPIRQLKDTARRKGLRLLRQAAVEAVAEGKTTLEEINRVTFITA
ncbi:GspE/PulE family protein [Methylovorus glucosotrophus]|uniref:Type II secretion system protein E n=1 Tax=Methylovorus glucosotrophus (strain SIP3-4) TaxID=582744 RepID=C6XCJ8_METGS|nr:GspE/PulE family protein [Methylovorus glucosotrophus]ACT50273.1 type II secretion system protein E [Methylovorus glucosotrophus SIP3-4]